MYDANTVWLLTTLIADKLPYSIRILLESAIRNCDGFKVTTKDVEKILDWEYNSTKHVEIQFKPARVLLQDFTGVPAVLDLASMRDAMKRLGGDPKKINPMVPVDLVVDHSIQADVVRTEKALQANMELEFQRNKERFGFLKWGSTAFDNMLVVPPGSGIVHQVNLEYLARVVFKTEGMLYPDTVVGTDSHTTMIVGLGVAGWGVGSIEAESAMLGQGFGVPKQVQTNVANFTFHGLPAQLRHGDVVIAAITSCTNTSNPSVMIAAGLVAKKARKFGLEVRPLIKTSLAPGSGVVTKYLLKSGLQTYMDELGFNVIGYGCTTCIGNFGDLDESVASAITENDIIAAAVLSGNRNFEGRIHPFTRANYLASPPLVVVYALAGTVNIDFGTEPIGLAKDGNKIYLRDIWPTNEEVADIEQSNVLPDMFKATYEAITSGNSMWNMLSVPSSTLYEWDPQSTYIKEPPYFQDITMSPPGPHGVKNAYCLLKFGDSVPIDHISPAGSIPNDSTAAKYLMENGVERRYFNSYGSHRGNHEVMTRGTFANTSLDNKLLDEVGPKTVHIPSGEKLSVFEAAMRYKNEGHDTIILAGAEYGSGSSRDWAAKGSMLLGVRAIIAKSFKTIHRSNLVGMGIMPLCFKGREDINTLGLSGHQRYSIDLPSSVQEMKPGQNIDVVTDNGKSFTCTLRFDTEMELAYFDHGELLHYVIRNLADSNA